MRWTRRFSLTEKEQINKAKNKLKLFQEKEKVRVTEPVTLYCDNPEHPLFSIKVTVDKPIAVCYYCSKTWILKQ